MKDKKILIGTALVLLLLLTTGLSYAYFSASVKGNDNVKDMVVEAGTLKLTYTDGPAINAQNIKPGWSTTKEVSVKNNGTLDAYYNIIWKSLTNGITNDELVLSATCQRLNTSGTVEGTCEPISQTPIKETTISSNILIENGVTHKYTFTILFKETNADQNYNQGKEFNGVLGIEESKLESTSCTYNGELVQGAEYVNGQYTYYYNQKIEQQPDGTLAPVNADINGWSVELTDKDSTEPVTSKLCNSINNKSIVSMAGMFSHSQATTLDLSSFDTSNVTDMSYMFRSSQTTTIDVSNFDTSKVTNMSSMFQKSQATTLDVSNFDTSNVTNMMGMFSVSQATTIDVSSFDTSNVINMQGMFSSSTNLKTIYASSKFNINYVGFDMFYNTPNLVGGAGTTWDSNHTHADYAHIDGGEANPGYFTDIADKK